MTFEDFWSLYPRRVAKKDAQKAWARMSEGDRALAIQSLPTHIRYWEAAGRGKEYIPYPASWLHGERWADELEMPAEEWWKTQQGIERKATELGIVAKAGEGWHELKARIRKVA